VILNGFLKAAGACGSCGKEDELRYGSCFSCKDKVKVRHLGDGLFSARNTENGKTYLTKTHGPSMQKCGTCGKPAAKLKDGACSSCSFFAGKRKKVASKRTALPKYVKCGGPGGQYPTAVCKKCGYDGNPQERRRSKTAGLARRFRLNLAAQKATEQGRSLTTPVGKHLLGGARQGLHFDNEVASMKVQRRVTNVMGKGLDPYMAYSESRGVMNDAARQTGLRSRILGHAGIADPGGMKHAAFWGPPRGAFPYRGDLRGIALNPETGMPTQVRETLLDEHYRRMSAERPTNLGEAAVGGAARGGAFGAAVTGIRAMMAFRSGGATIGDSIGRAATPALIGGGIGAGLGTPVGFVRGYMRNRDIRNAQKYTGSDISTRQNWVRSEVNHSLGVG